MAERARVRAMVDPGVGEAIRSARSNRGLKLVELARLAGVSPSALSQIEHGKVHPSMPTLRRIAAGLGVPVFGLEEDGGEHRDVAVVRAGQRKTLGIPGSRVTYELLSPNLLGQIEVLYYEIAVGDVTHEDGLSHPGEECCVVLRGRGRLEIDGQAFDLEEGDAATYQSGRRHALRNIGDVPLLAISAITPPNF